MEWVWLWALPMVLMIIFNLYQRFNLKHPFDRFWSILWILVSLVPILNWIVFGLTVVLLVVMGLGGDLSKYLIKETRLNRWLFASKFND